MEDSNIDRPTSVSDWQAVLAGMLDPVVTIDKIGTILYANDSCFKTFGYKPDELIGLNIRLLMPEPYHSDHDQYLLNYRNTGETHILGRTREFPVVHKEGHEIQIELSVARIELPGKSEPLYCGSFRDITARKRAEAALSESERKFRAIFDQEFQFVGLLDPTGVLLEVNRAALDLAGAELADVIGKPFWDTPWWAHSREEQERLKRAVRRAAAGEFVRFETTHQGADESVSSVDFSLKPFRDEEGRIVLLLPEGRDITDVKNAQNREISMMRAFADIGESASLLAHEIKNPITAVNTALRAVAKQLGADEQDVLHDLVERMKKLESLMHRTLSLARPLDLSMEECDVEQLVTSVTDLMRPHADANGVTIEVAVAHDCPKLHADQQLLEEVLTNLVRNALDALEDGGLVRVEARLVQDRIHLSVDDNGHGIPELVLTTLFKPFVSTKSSGTGLGLSIARKVIEAHGGTIEAHQSPLGGARFEIDLPASE